MSDTTILPNAPRVALIGFGEAGEKFARAGRWNQERYFQPSRAGIPVRAST